MWLFPWLTYVAMAAMIAVIVSMALVDEARPQLVPSFISLGVVLLAARWRERRRAGTQSAPAGRRVPAT